jgi:hypothetical protein
MHVPFGKQWLSLYEEELHDAVALTSDVALETEGPPALVGGNTVSPRSSSTSALGMHYPGRCKCLSRRGQEEGRCCQQESRRKKYVRLYSPSVRSLIQNIRSTCFFSRA